MSYVINFDKEDNIPFCIICQENIIENSKSQIIKNELCSCNFQYHQFCYEKWINLVKEKKCLMCRNDISMNFLHTQPFDLSNNQITTRRRPPFVNIAMMSPRSRYRYGVPFMYRPRPNNFCDRCLNFISCNDIHRNNPIVNWTHDNYCLVFASMFITFFISLIILAFIYLIIIH